MRVVIFDTPERQAQGLQHRSPIDPDTIFVFPLVEPGWVFHSRNVREPFDLAFIRNDGVIILKKTVVPERQEVVAPSGTYMALESKAGYMASLGWWPGVRATF